MTELELQQIEIQRLREQLAEAEAKLQNQMPDKFTINPQPLDIKVRKIFLVGDNTEISTDVELEQYLAFNEEAYLRFEMEDGTIKTIYELGEEEWN